MAAALDSVRLRTLLRTAQLARRAEPEEALPEIASSIAGTLGWQTVVINLYRPAWDDFEVVAAHGPRKVHAMLLGTTAVREDWLILLDPRHERRGAHMLPAGVIAHEPAMAEYVPELPVDDDPGAWQAGDMLLVPLRDERGELLGVVSVDEPLTARRPGDEELDLLVVCSEYVALALEQCAERRRSQRHARAVEQLMRVAAAMSAGSSSDEVLELICAGISDVLDFEKVAIYMAEGDAVLRPHAEIGWEDAGGVPLRELPRQLAESLMSALPQSNGCTLADGPTAQALLPAGFPQTYRSRRNGRGPHAWNHHWLLVPLRDEQDRLLGGIWVDDPLDRLLPEPERLQALRLFADQAAGVLQAVSRLNQMRAMAERDPLTELANRRAFRAFLSRVEAGEPLALLVLDLDHFKRVNDELGHEAGDATLVRFARLLERAARPGDLAVRLGGEEFALVLPGADAATALSVAERVRLATGEHFADLPGGLTVSAGITASATAGHSPARLLRDADRALYTAKRSGRDRSVLNQSNRTDAPAAARPAAAEPAG